MTLSILISLLTFMCSLAFSIITAIYSKKQVEIAREQLEHDTKPKFTDEPINSYTLKLDSISRNVENLANQVEKLSEILSKR